MTASSPNRPRPSRRRLLLFAVIGLTVSAVLACGGVIAIFSYGQFQKGQQRKAQGAIVEYFDAIQFRDKERLDRALCPGQDAGAHLKRLYTRLAEANFELQALSWIPAA